MGPTYMGLPVNSNVNPNPGSTVGDIGWTCSQCKVWVPTNVYHICSRYKPPFATNLTLDGKLNRIIELLEQLVKGSA